MSSPPIGVILLAAGGSTRLGSPKQLLTYQGKTLLRHAAETALATGCRPVVAVLGSSAERLRVELAGLDVRLVDNSAWTRGMGTSVRLGVAALDTDAAGVLLMLCDQPLIAAEHLARLIAAFRQNAGMGIVAAAYHDTVGVPVLFARTYFDELRTLPDGAGAKPILQRHRDAVLPVPLPEAAVDIDTREQYGTAGRRQLKRIAIAGGLQLPRSGFVTKVRTALRAVPMLSAFRRLPPP